VVSKIYPGAQKSGGLWRALNGSLKEGLLFRIQDVGTVEVVVDNLC
jgi:hypothetical protein